MSDQEDPDKSTPIVPAIVENRGRFQAGNRAAVGRQSRQQRLRNAIFAAVTIEDIKSITQGLVFKAIAGDLDAAKLLLGFIGKGTAGPLVAIQNNSTGTPETPRQGGLSKASEILARLMERRASEQGKAQGGADDAEQ
jgi:hypothetical protein